MGKPQGTDDEGEELPHAGKGFRSRLSLKASAGKPLISSG